MFDIYELNSETETVENKASKLLENGFVRISSNSNVVDKDTLNKTALKIVSDGVNGQRNLPYLKIIEPIFMCHIFMISI